VQLLSLFIARCRALVVKFLGGDVRIELSNYSDIRELVVDGKPGFSPRGVSIIMGKSGSGKMLLANALYMEPVLTIIVIQRGFYVIIIYNTPPQTSSQAQPQS